MMHAAARNAYYNRGSKAAWEQHVKERDAEMGAFVTFIMFICGLIITPFALLFIFGLTLLYGPTVWAISGLIFLSIMYLRSVS